MLVEFVLSLLALVFVISDLILLSFKLSLVSISPALLSALKTFVVLSLSPAKITTFLLFCTYSFMRSSRSLTSPFTKLISLVLKSFFKVSCSNKFTLSLMSKV